MFGGDNPRDFLEVVLEQLPQFEHRSRAGDGRRFAPSWKGGGRRLHRGVDLGLRGERRASDDFATRGVVYGHEVAGRGRCPAAADEVGKKFRLFRHDGSLYSVALGPAMTTARPSSGDRPCHGNVAEFARVTQQSPADGRRLMSHATHYVIRGGIHGRERLRVISRIMHPTSSSLLDRLELHEGLVCADFGCGGGDLTVELARRVGPTGKAFGFDIDQTKLDIARAEAERLGVSNVEFHASDLRHSSFTHSFDVVYTRFLLTHLKDPGTLVRMFFDHLRPGGRMAVEDIAANPTTLAGTPRIVQSWGRRPD